jgi:hypothetical protein
MRDWLLKFKDQIQFCKEDWNNFILKNLSFIKRRDWPDKLFPKVSKQLLYAF